MTTTFKLEFPFKVNSPTINGHIYPRDVLMKAISEAQKTIAERRMFGELNSDRIPVRLEHVSHLVTDLKLEDDNVVATIEVLDTPAGNALSKLHEAKVPLELLPIGYGDCDEETMIITGYSIPLIHVHTKNE